MACGLLSDFSSPAASDLAVSPEVVGARLVLYEKLLSKVEENCGERPRGRLLDAGCGTGEFLELARARGWRASGVELHQAAAKAAASKGLDVRTGRLSQAGFPKESFDVITLWDVLDCAENPALELKEAFRILKPGGMIWTRVRNAPFHLACADVGRWLRLDFLSILAVLHRNGFSRAVLKRALEQGGFLDAAFEKTPLADVKFYSRDLNPVAARVVMAAKELALASPSLLARAQKPATSRRILHLITRLDAGGSSATVRALAQGSCILACGPGAEGTPPGAVSVPHLTREIRPVSDARSFFEILRLLIKMKPAVLHTHTSKAGFLGRWAGWALNQTAFKKNPMRLVHTPHGHVFYGYFGPAKSLLFLWLEVLSARITDELVAVSEGERRESLERGVGSPKQWTVIAAAFEGAFPIVPVAAARKKALRSFGVPVSALLFGTVARLEVVKGVHVLLEAAAAVLKAGPPRPIRFLVIGDGGRRAELERQARSLGLAECVVFAGFQQNFTELMRAMDIYVQPSLNEGMGQALLCAQALGLPIAASRVCAIPEIINHGESGLLAAPGDVPALARVLLRLAREPELRKTLAQGASRAAARRAQAGLSCFRVDEMRDRYKKVYAAWDSHNIEHGGVR